MRYNITPFLVFLTLACVCYQQAIVSSSLEQASSDHFQYLQPYVVLPTKVLNGERLKASSGFENDKENPRSLLRAHSNDSNDSNQDANLVSSMSDVGEKPGDAAAGTTIEGHSNNSVKYLGCGGIEELLQMASTKLLGGGFLKNVYELHLGKDRRPAVAKICHREPCLAPREARMLRQLQDQFSHEQTVQVYGWCNHTNFTGSSISSSLPARQGERDDGTRPTSVIELGEPLIRFNKILQPRTPEHESFSDCFTSLMQEDDLEDFRIMARQYSELKPAPFVIPYSQRLDNIYLDQYARMKAGLRQIDLDNVVDCAMIDSATVPECDPEEALHANCKVFLKRVARQKEWNCTLEYSEELKSKRPPHEIGTKRMNVTEARNFCNAKVQREMNVTVD